MNTPIMAASRASMKNENSRTRWSTDSHEHSSAIGVRNVVSTTRNSVMPSIPTWYEMPKSGIHV